MQILDQNITFSKPYFLLLCLSVEDFCDSHPCKNGGTCSLSKDYYKCDCPTGLKGTNCEQGKS